MRHLFGAALLLMSLASGGFAEPAADKTALKAWCLAQAAEEAGRIDDVPLLARLALAQAKAGDPAACAKTLALAQQRAAAAPTHERQCQAHAHLAAAFAQSGDTTAYERQLALTLEQLERISNPQTRNLLCRELATLQVSSGDLEGWKRTVPTATGLYDQADIYAGVAYALARRGAAPQCREALKLADDIIARIENARDNPLDLASVPMLRRNAVRPLAILGDFESAAAVADALPASEWKAWAYLSLAEEQLAQKRKDLASENLRRALAVPAAALTWGQMPILLDLLRLADQAGQKELVQSALARANTLAESLADPEKQSVAYLQLATAQTRLGDAAAAARSLSIAQAAARSLKNPLDPQMIGPHYRALAAAQAARGQVQAAQATCLLIADRALLQIAQVEVARELTRAGKLAEAEALLASVYNPRQRADMARAIARERAAGSAPAQTQQWIESLLTSPEKVSACIAIVESLGQ